MHVTLVQVHVKSENIGDFIAATQLNHEASVKEPGNRRFDVLQMTDDPQCFVLYEAYVDEAAAKAHKQTQHYLIWREVVAEWMASPRTGISYKGLYPSGGDSNA